ncbi:hypothetical protein E4U41_005647 [Claviceps citrina]|nr:hypothetical protein E4U41_005647 [Claviceps citrina]
MAEKYVLRITAGPSYDTLTHVEVPVNNPEPTSIDSDGADIKLNVRIQNYSGLPRGSPSTSAYFSTEPHARNQDQYSISVQFTPRKRASSKDENRIDVEKAGQGISGHDLQFGNDFDRPIRDRLPPGFNTALSIVRWWIDPGLEGDAYADKPYLYGPALSSFNVLHVGAGVCDAKKGGLWFEEGGDEDGMKVRQAAGMPAERKARMKWALRNDSKSKWCFEYGKTYGLDFYNPYLDFTNLALKLPGFHLPIVKYWDGQGLRRHRNAVVVRDRDSQRLEIRGSECPTCHQPLARSPSPERSYDRPFDRSHEFVDPEYFRMLRAGNFDFTTLGNGPPSPIRRLVEPASVAGSPNQNQSTSSPPGAAQRQRQAGFSVNDAGPHPAERSRIRREAFSPNYFKTFFVEERTLGKGGKGVVLLVRHEIDGCALGHFACKRVPVGDDHSWLEKVLIEVELLAKLSHPNLVSYRHVWLEDVRLTRFGPSVACAFILQQYCNGGDLHQYVVGGAPREATKEELKAQMRRRSRGHADMPLDPFCARPQLSFEEIFSLFKDITSGVAYLHGANYIHRDLKPSNCLLHSEAGKLTCLISDFGEVQAENVVRKSTGSTGTISYCAPEVLRMDASGQYGNFTTKSDVFSLGMILYFMCFGRLPYQGADAIHEELEDIDQLRAEIVDWQGFQDERQERPDLPSKLYKLLKKLLALDPAERPGASEVLLAMRSETNFDNITNNDRTAPGSSTLRGHRIENLDSPAPPGTPVSDVKKDSLRGRQPTKNENISLSSHFTHGRRASQELGPPSSLQKGSREREHHSRGPPGSVQQEHGQAAEPAQPSTPHLLMAPPRTRGEELRYQLTMLGHGLVSGIDGEVTESVTRLTVFFLKLFTLSQPCWPYVASIEVGFPLMAFAAMELGWPGSLLHLGWSAGQRNGPWMQRRNQIWLNLVVRVVSLGFHLGILWTARRWDVLCSGRRQDEWLQ